MKTTVVNIRTHKYDVYIGRGGRGHDGYWGNPFSVGKDGDRRRVLKLYQEYFNNRIIDDPKFFEKLQGLIGKKLACFCSPHRCHGDIMAYYLNIEPGIKPWVDELIRAGFSTFSSCEGGENHPCTTRTIRMYPDRPVTEGLVCCPRMDSDGRKKIFERFELLCDFVEKQDWTFCVPKILWPYYVEDADMNLEPHPHFELEWN